MHNMKNIKTFTQFKEYFDNDIKMLLDWDKLETSKPNIYHIDVDVKKSGNTIFTPWYINQNMAPSDYLDPEAVPQSIFQISNNKLMMEHHNCIKILRNNASLCFPAFDLGSKKYLLLDGNHRAVASIFSDEKELYIQLCVISCEIDPDFLPDLLHWHKI